MKTMKVGVVGVGYLGQYHAEKYANLPEATLVGIVDSDQTRAAFVADRVRARVFAEPDELLDAVDAVSIVVPTALHYQVAKPFFGAGHTRFFGETGHGNGRAGR